MSTLIDILCTREMRSLIQKKVLLAPITLVAHIRDLTLNKQYAELEEDYVVDGSCSSREIIGYSGRVNLRRGFQSRKCNLVSTRGGTQTPMGKIEACNHVYGHNALSWPEHYSIDHTSLSTTHINHTIFQIIIPKQARLTTLISDTPGPFVYSRIIAISQLTKNFIPREVGIPPSKEKLSSQLWLLNLAFKSKENMSHLT